MPQPTVLVSCPCGHTLVIYGDGQDSDVMHVFLKQLTTLTELLENLERSEASDPGYTTVS